MKPQRTNMTSLIFGAVFLIIAGVWFVNRYTEFDIPNLGWILAPALIVLGLIGIVTSLTARRPPVTTAAAPATTEPTIVTEPDSVVDDHTVPDDVDPAHRPPSESL